MCYDGDNHVCQFLCTGSQKPNCKVRLVMVDGDWRVAIQANKNIQANEELFYDYRWGVVYVGCA